MQNATLALDKLPPSPAQRRFGKYRHYPAGAACVNAPVPGRFRGCRKGLGVSVAGSNFYRIPQDLSLALFPNVPIGKVPNERNPGASNSKTPIKPIVSETCRTVAYNAWWIDDLTRVSLAKKQGGNRVLVYNDRNRALQQRD
jgi:hypothetical protein